MAKYDLSNLFLERDVKRDEGLLSKWGSQAASGASTGGTIGSLIGTYGLPMLLGILSGGTLAGPALLAASAGGAALGSQIGGTLGAGSAGDAPDTRFAIGSKADAMNAISGNIFDSALVSGVTSLGSGLYKGAEAGGALQKDIYKPMDWLLQKSSQIDPDMAGVTAPFTPQVHPGVSPLTGPTVPSLGPISTSTGNTGVSLNVPQSPISNIQLPQAFHPDKIASHTQKGFEQSRGGLLQGLRTDLDELYRPGGYYGLDTSTGSQYTAQDMEKLLTGGLGEENPYWAQMGERFDLTPEATRAQALEQMTWQNIKQSPMESLLKEYGLDPSMLTSQGGSTILNLLINQIKQG